MIWKNDETQLEGQMSIFDCFQDLVEDKRKIEYDLETLDEAEMVRIISDALGIKFTDVGGYWRAQPAKGVTCDLNYSRYSCDGVGFKEGQRFISCSCGVNTAGSSGPYDTVASAIQFFEHYIPKYSAEVKK